MHYICSTLHVVITMHGFKTLDIKAETLEFLSLIILIKTKSHECQREF